MSRDYNSSSTLNPYTIRPTEIESQDRLGYKVVAVVFDNGYWCAYKGLTDWTDLYTQKHGDAVSYEVARLLFPALADSKFTWSGY